MFIRWKEWNQQERNQSELDFPVPAATRLVWVVCSCGTTWPTWSEIWSMDPEVDPWETMIGLDPCRLGPVWATIHALQISEALFKKKLSVWSTVVVGPLCPPDHWSVSHILKEAQGRPGWWWSHVEWAPSAPSSRNSISRWRETYSGEFLEIVKVPGPSMDTWYWIRTMGFPVGPWATLESTPDHALGQQDPLHLMPRWFQVWIAFFRLWVCTWSLEGVHNLGTAPGPWVQLQYNLPT